MKKAGVWLLMIGAAVAIGYVGHLIDSPSTNYNNSAGQSTENDYSPSSHNNTSKKCSYCGTSFSGDGYNYSFGQCHKGSDIYYSKCSLKCCRESLQNDTNLSRKWK